MHYLDASAIVKLVSPEPETAALVDALRVDPDGISSTLARVEVTRAVLRSGASADRIDRASAVLDRITLVPIDAETIDLAARLDPRDLRSLDAIHLATALQLRDDIAGVVTYDAGLAGAADAVGLAVFSPS